VDGVEVLDLVNAQGIIVLHYPTGVDKTLPLNRDILEFSCGELGLEVEHGGRLGHGESMDLISRGLHLEGDLRGLGGRLAAISHDCAACED